MCDAIIDYVVGKDLLEPLGGAPTSSIILQVRQLLLSEPENFIHSMKNRNIKTTRLTERYKARRQIQDSVV